MRDPIERITRFVREQQRQAALERARAAWSRRLPTLVTTVRAVVDAFRGGVAELPEAPGVAVLCDPRRADYPLVIAFERRPTDGKLPGGAFEAGASCLFRCEADGAVYGFRYPFHAELRDVRPERFVDLGEPDGVSAGQLGHAAAEFLEWAAAGAGCGSRRLRFSAAGPRRDVIELPRLLRVVAA